MDPRLIGLRRLRLTGGVAASPLIAFFCYDFTYQDDAQGHIACLALVLATFLSVELCAQAGARAVGRDASYLAVLTPAFGPVVFLIVMLLMQAYRHEPVDWFWLGAMIPSGIFYGLFWGGFIGAVASACVQRRQKVLHATRKVLVRPLLQKLPRLKQQEEHHVRQRHAQRA
jgi:hypothetical protein